MITSAPCALNSDQASSPSRATTAEFPCRSIKSCNSSRMPTSSSAISTRMPLSNLLVVKPACYTIGNLPQVCNAIGLGDHLVDTALAGLFGIDGRTPASHQHKARIGRLLANRRGDIPAILAWAQAEIGNDQLETIALQMLERLLARRCPNPFV